MGSEKERKIKGYNYEKWYCTLTDWKWGQAVRQESWQEIESESLLLGKAVTTRRVPES